MSGQRLVVGTASGAQDLGDGDDLLARQSIQRMGDGGRSHRPSLNQDERHKRRPIRIADPLSIQIFHGNATS